MSTLSTYLILILAVFDVIILSITGVSTSVAMHQLFVPTNYCYLGPSIDRLHVMRKGYFKGP